MNVDIKQMKEDAVECLKEHGENGFCENWGCKTILYLIDEIERLWNEQTGDLATATLKAELAKKDEVIAVAKVALNFYENGHDGGTIARETIKKIKELEGEE